MGVPKPTEMTIRDLLQEELRKRGVTVVPEFSVSTPTGVLKPDILLRNGAPYVVETKLGVETKLLEAMVKLYDYSKYVTEAKGAFAVLFPQELRQPWSDEVILNLARNLKTEYVVMAIFKDLRPSQRFAGNLSEVADWMAGHVLRAPVVEADTGFAIRVLRDAVSYITASVRQLRGKELEDIFGGKTVFENILQYEEDRYPLEEMRQAATYLLVNQLLFYHVLSRMDANFPAVDEEKIGKPADLAQYFDPVLKRDYSSIFGFDVASRLPEHANEVVKKVVMVVKALAPEKIRHDLLGKVFHELIPFEIRKAVAAFYTNNEAAEMLAELVIDKPDAKVMDLAVGSGTLLVAAYRRKRELLQKLKGTIELEDHKRFLEQDFTGIDVMPFAAHLAVVHLSLQALLYETEKVRVAVWDSTELRPGQIIPAISSELKRAYKRPTLEMFMKGRTLGKEAYLEKGAVTLEGVGGEQIALEHVDSIIMNPPFTRQQRIPHEYKEVLKKRFADQSQYVHGQMGYHGYFMLLANRFIKDAGRLGLVLPASVLNADGFLKIRELLLSKYQIEHIITTWQRAAFSERAQFREILLIAKKEDVVSEEGICAVTELKKLPRSLEEARAFASLMREIAKSRGLGLVYEDDNMQVSLLPTAELRRHKNNLFRFIAFRDKKLIELFEQVVKRAKNRLTPLGDYLDKHGKGPKEGAALGQVLKGGAIGTFYVLKDPAKAYKKVDVWVLKHLQGRQALIEHQKLHNSLNVPLRAMRPAMRRFSGMNMIDISNELDYMIAEEFPKIGEFLSVGRGRKVSANFFKVWKRYIDGLAGNLLLANHVDVSAPGTSALAYYASTPVIVPRSMWSIKVPDDAGKILALWLNSTLGLLQTLMLRRETRGAYIWLVASTIREFMAPNLDSIPQKELQMTLRLFNEMRYKQLPNILEQLNTRSQDRVQMDRLMLRLLGLGDDEINRILDYLYPALANEIEQLKTLMQG